jgi:uncharacterized glyoxalase superfamily protein PhnB
VERFHYGPDDTPGGAQLSAGGGTVMISRSRTGQGPGWGDSAALTPQRTGEVSAILSVHVDDVDAHFERAKEFGASILHEPETYPFGERQYTAEDLAGYRWVFSQTVADVAPEDWGAISGPALSDR